MGLCYGQPSAGRIRKPTPLIVRPAPNHGRAAGVTTEEDGRKFNPPRILHLIEWNVLHIAEGQFLTLVDTGRANQTGFQFQQEQLQRLLLLFPKTQRRQLARGGARHVVIGKGESETPGPIKRLNRR